MTGRHESYTDHFGLAGRQVPFEDLDVFDDTRLFIDPHRIRQTDLSDDLRYDAVESLDSFLGALTERVLSGAADPRRAPHEPRGASRDPYRPVGKRL